MRVNVGMLDKGFVVRVSVDIPENKISVIQMLVRIVVRNGHDAPEMIGELVRGISRFPRFFSLHNDMDYAGYWVVINPTHKLVVCSDGRWIAFENINEIDMPVLFKEN